MEFPPTKEAYEALLTRVKTLEEELKRVRNDKKENGSSLAEVEFQPLKTERKAKSYFKYGLEALAYALYSNKTSRLQRYIKFLSCT